MTQKKSPSTVAAGFTLIEVMVGIVLAGILITGLTSLWALVGEEFHRLTLRQKAVFVLNGEMERLAVVYRLETPLTQTVTFGAESRLIYNAAHATGAIVDTNNDFLVGEVFYHSAGGNGDRNLVWLDRAKNVVANISWTAPNLQSVAVAESPVSQAQDCQATSCVLLTLYLEYPYRFDLTTSKGKGRNLQAMTPVRTISLKTIMGRKM